jgi:hypothetical protein
MNAIEVIVTGPEEAYNNEAEFWCGDLLMGFTVLHEGRLHLRWFRRSEDRALTRATIPAIFLRRGGCSTATAMPT